MTHPNYTKVITHLKATGYLQNEGLSDHLEEMLLNDFVQVIKENHPQLIEDEVIDTVYDSIRKVLGSFEYYVDCATSEGYDAAMYDTKNINEDVYNKLIEDVHKSSKE